MHEAYIMRVDMDGRGDRRWIAFDAKQQLRGNKNESKDALARRFRRDCLDDAPAGSVHWTRYTGVSRLSEFAATAASIVMEAEENA